MDIYVRISWSPVRPCQRSFTVPQISCRDSHKSSSSPSFIILQGLQGIICGQNHHPLRLVSQGQLPQYSSSCVIPLPLWLTLTLVLQITESHCDLLPLWGFNFKLHLSECSEKYLVATTQFYVKKHFPCSVYPEFPAYSASPDHSEF